MGGKLPLAKSHPHVDFVTCAVCWQAAQTPVPRMKLGAGPRSVPARAIGDLDHKTGADTKKRRCLYQVPVSGRSRSRFTFPSNTWVLSFLRMSAAPSLLVHTRRTPPPGSASSAEIPTFAERQRVTTTPSSRLRLTTRLIAAGSMGRACKLDCRNDRRALPAP